jgi:hypothetical protein
MQITQQKNCLTAQYLISKDPDPKLSHDTHLFAKESFIITDSTISLQSNSVFDMTYWPNLHVRTQPYFAPLQTYQFLSFAATSLPAELMGD